MSLGNTFNKPKSNTADSGYKKKAVVTVLEAETYASQAQGDPPSP